MINKHLIQQRFSRYAHSYDTYASIQKITAEELGARLPKNNISSILDVGCGTGIFTQMLFKRYPDARITACDISQEMIETARQKFAAGSIELVTADGEDLPDLAEQYDLICSNASFQWFEHLDQTLKQYQKLLTKNGAIYFSTFGPSTLKELQQTIRDCMGKDTMFSSDLFLHKELLARVMASLFKKYEVEELLYSKSYTSLNHLLKVIKCTGATGYGSGISHVWTPATLKKLEDRYINNFKTITATYQIYYCKGIL